MGSILWRQTKVLLRRCKKIDTQTMYEVEIMSKTWFRFILIKLKAPLLTGTLTTSKGCVDTVPGSELTSCKNVALTLLEVLLTLQTLLSSFREIFALEHDHSDPLSKANNFFNAVIPLFCWFCGSSFKGFFNCFPIFWLAKVKSSQKSDRTWFLWTFFAPYL